MNILVWILVMLVKEQVLASAVECDFTKEVVEECTAVIEVPFNITTTKVIQNAHIELGCPKDEDCILIPAQSNVTISHTDVTCVAGSGGIGLDGKLSLNTVTMSSCAPAIMVSDASAILQVYDSHFEKNTNKAIAVARASVILIDGSTFTGNDWLGEDGYDGGAGLQVAHSESVTITNSEFNSNLARGAGWSYGGGAYVSNSVSLTVKTTKFINNTIIGADGGYGGGLSVRNTPTTVSNTVFNINTGAGGEFGGSGGGLYLAGSDGIINGCQFTGNIATGGSGHGGGMRAYDSNSLTIRGCHYESNTADSVNHGHGGMLDASKISNVTITLTTAADNMADDIYCYSSNFYLDSEGFVVTKGTNCEVNILP